MFALWILVPIALLFNPVNAMEETIDPHAADNICSSNNTCFKSTKGCPLANDCAVAYSLNENTSSLLVSHLAFGTYIVLYHHINEVRQDQILICYPYKCFIGKEPKNDTLIVPHIQKHTFFVIDEDLEQYLYEFPRIVVPTGSAITYSFRYGSPEEQYIDPPSTPLKYVETSKPVVENKVNETGKDLRSIAKIYDDFNKFERAGYVEDIVANDRAKKESTATVVPLTDFNEVYANRMVFDKEKDSTN